MGGGCGGTMVLGVALLEVVSLPSDNVDLVGSTKQMGGNQRISAQKLR